jgi:hypothetical protein
MGLTVVGTVAFRSFTIVRVGSRLRESLTGGWVDRWNGRMVGS